MTFSCNKRQSAKPKTPVKDTGAVALNIAYSSFLFVKVRREIPHNLLNLETHLKLPKEHSQTVAATSVFFLNKQICNL